jgi:hypothetical protein
MESKTVIDPVAADGAASAAESRRVAVAVAPDWATLFPERR